MSEIVGALQAVKAASELLVGIVRAKVDAKVEAALLDVRQRLIDAQEDLLAAQMQRSQLEEELKEVKRQLMSAEAWEQEKTRYKLTLPPGLYSHVYAVKRSAAAPEPAHYACPHCYQQGRKSILYVKASREGWTALACPCGVELSTGTRGPAEFHYAPD